MPEIQVNLFAEADGSCPLLDWLSDAQMMPEKARDKCIVRVERLKERGHELRRPEADYLRDEIYELRTRLGNVNYRMLYFFAEGCAVISHGLTKEGKIPGKEIELAMARREMFRKDPIQHTYMEQP